MPDSIETETPGQLLFERYNPWSRDAQFNGKFSWGSQTDALRAIWEATAAAKTLALLAPKSTDSESVD